jgi:hypothetical protein
MNMQLKNKKVMILTQRCGHITNVDISTPALKGETMGFSIMLKSPLGDLGEVRENQIH